MLTINDDVIKMTKGDTAIFTITIYTPDDGKVYNLKHNDKVVFYLSKYPCESIVRSPILTKEFKDNIIKIDPEDTEYLKYGTYYWKCELIYANGDISSVAWGRYYLVCEA